jgi:hypothetical protein
MPKIEILKPGHSAYGHKDGSAHVNIKTARRR